MCGGTPLMLPHNNCPQKPGCQLTRLPGVLFLKTCKSNSGPTTVLISEIIALDHYVKKTMKIRDIFKGVF